MPTHKPSVHLSFFGILALTLSLQGCGGGGGGDSPAAGGGDASPAPSQGGSSQSPTLVAQDLTLTSGNFDAASVSAGWNYATGPSLYTASANTYLLSNSGNVASTTVSAATATINGVSTQVYSLQYNFGCNTTSIVLRTQDCRNVVSMYAPLDRSKTVSPNAAISFYARNVDASAQFALRVTNAAGQSFQYPFSTRSIEAQDPSQWVRVTVPLRYPSNYWASSGTNNGVPQGQLNVVEIVASARNSTYADKGLNYPVGRIDIANVEWFDNLSTSYTLAPNNAVKVNGFDTYHPVMAVAHNDFNPVLLDKAKAVGFDAIRKDLFWDAVEVNGAFNFSAFTTGLQTLQAKQMKVLWILDYGHPDHGGGLPPQNTADINAYATFAKKAAQLTATYSNVVGYEIWNESDQDGFWPTPDPVKYANLLNAARTAIRQVDTTTPIVSAGIAIDTPDYLYKLAQTGALNSITGIGVHPYRPDIITTTSPTYKRTVNTPENYAGEIVPNQIALQSLGVTKPMWSTEWGYSTVFFMDANVYGDGNSAAAATRQGSLVLRLVLTQLAMKEPLITVFNLVDRGTDPADKEHHFGLLKPASLGYAEKPSYTALKTLHQHTANRTFKGYLTDVPTGMHVLRWDGTSDRAFCAWADDQGRPVTMKLPAGRSLRVTSWDGTVLTPTTNSDGTRSVSLTEQGGPVFVLFQ
jgi:hypothetical protein